MVANAINNTPNIFLQGSQLYQGANSRILDAINSAVDMYQQMQDRKQGTLNAERLKQMDIDAQKAKVAAEQSQDPQFILAKAIQNGPGSLTPQERATFDAAQKIEGAKVAVQPLTGQAYQPYNPIDLNAMAAPATTPVAVGGSPVSNLLLPPRSDGTAGTQSQFESEILSPPAPVGKDKEKTTFTDTTGMGATPAGQMKRYEKELDFYGQRLSKNLDAEQDEKTVTKSKELAQRALDRMMQLNEELKANGAVVSADQGTVANVKAMARGAKLGAPFLGSADVGAAGEKVFDPATKAKREEYDRLRSTLLPFYAKASGLGSKSLDSEGERASILDSFGNPNGTYEGNKAQLENLSSMIGTGAAAKKVESGGVDTKLKAAGYSQAQIDAYKRAKGIK